MNGGGGDPCYFSGMVSVVLALAAAVPLVWVGERASDDARCTGDAVAKAIQALVPETEVKVGQRAGDPDVQVELAESAQGFSLSVSGGRAPFTRLLPETGKQCVEAVNLTALIVSRYLDELPWRATSPPPVVEVRRPPPPPPTKVVADFGLIASQIAAGLSPGLTLDLGLRKGVVFALLGGDLVLDQHPPVIAGGNDGSYLVQSDAVRAMAGLALPLGPGAVSLEAGGGVFVTSVSVVSGVLFQKNPQSAAEAFASLRVGYGLELPGKLLLALRYEERWVPSPTSFEVYPGISTVQSPKISGALSLVIGREFF
jgi:hypothetical protein